MGIWLISLFYRNRSLHLQKNLQSTVITHFRKKKKENGKEYFMYKQRRIIYAKEGKAEARI